MTLLPGLARAAGASPACAAPSLALTAEQAARDVRVLQRALKALHPALTKYRTQEELAAAIRCGHTWTNARNQSGATRAALLDASVTPGVPVKRTFEAQAAGVDQELEAVRRLIGQEGR